MLPVLVLAIVFAPMLAEAVRSRANERRLRARGAVEPAGDVYGWMQIAYPSSFLLMGAEAAWRGTSPGGWLAAGLALFAVAKALKYWAIAALGWRWTFRVLVLPGAPLVATGPYRLLRHPNYVAVAGELLGAALMFMAPLTGALAVAGFGALMKRRVRVEEGALGLRPERTS
jgi:methyltransferase